MLQRLWNKASLLGLTEFSEEEILSKYREIVLLNKLTFILLVTMLLYIPVEVAFHGYKLIPIILLETAFVCTTWIYTSKKWFRFAKQFFIFICITAIVPMLFAVPEGANNELFLLPVSLLPAILIEKKWRSFFVFVLIVGVYFLAIYARGIVKPLFDIPEDTLQFFSHIFISMVFLLVYTIVWYFRQHLEEFTKVVTKQRDQINDQHHVLEEKNKEIVDSINYAKRIQSAILPPLKMVKEHLTDSFVLYKPKDIVAGDFYWFEPLEHAGTSSDKVLFAAADCTGHGVPGAMVSVICNNGLNRSVREHGLTKPGEILDKTREIVIQEFEKSKDEVKDGMDIALCSLNGNILEFAGANNPLWLIRKSDYGDARIEILETKGNKQPIGKFDNLLPYTTHRLTLNEGDTFYLFSDGFPDQFGGEKGKKYKSGNFKKFLLSIQDKSMDEQLTLITIEFDKWKKGIEQVDDVCVMGVRI